MKKLIIGSFILLFSVSVQAEDSQPLTIWKIILHNSLGTTEYSPNKNGGNIPTGLLKSCIQEPMIIFKSKYGDYLEKVRITCPVGVLDTKVSIMTSCLLSKEDNKYAAMHVDDSSFNTFTLELACRTFIQ